MCYRQGDVLWGSFPCSDGGLDRIHPALVLTDPVSDGSVIAVVGTSQRVGRASAGGQVVVSHEQATDDEWKLCGLDLPASMPPTASWW